MKACKEIALGYRDNGEGSGGTCQNWSLVKAGDEAQSNTDGYDSRLFDSLT
jgi:hypothetical protein